MDILVPHQPAAVLVGRRPREFESESIPLPHPSPTTTRTIALAILAGLIGLAGGGLVARRAWARAA